MRKTIERAHTRVLARSKNWSGRLWYRKKVGKLVVSIGQSKHDLDSLTMYGVRTTKPKNSRKPVV